MDVDKVEDWFCTLGRILAPAIKAAVIDEYGNTIAENIGDIETRLGEISRHLERLCDIMEGK